MTTLPPITPFSEPRSDAQCCGDDRQKRAEPHVYPLKGADADWQLSALRRLLGARQFVGMQGVKK